MSPAHHHPTRTARAQAPLRQARPWGSSTRVDHGLASRVMQHAARAAPVDRSAAANHPSGSGAVPAAPGLSRPVYPEPPPADWADSSLADMLQLSDAEVSADSDDVVWGAEGVAEVAAGAEPDAGVLTQDEENPYTPDDALVPEEEGISGEPALEQLLVEAGRDLSIDRLRQLFTFPLDKFQATAIEHFVEGKSVVVCAPTGAGKTVIAEAAAAAALARGQRVIYTTPLKALSNQKLYELQRRFGTTRCGLQTGDTSLNTDAAVVVMTTEILRNIMYRTAELAAADESNPSFMSLDGSTSATSSPGSNTREARLGDVGLVVLDEVHYLGDPHRGSVWEEVIINCPRHIQLLCMSATVRNPEDLGNWISKEHQECVTVRTRFRPVPLQWHFAFSTQQGVVVEDLLDASGKALNPKLEPEEVMMSEARSLLRSNDPYSMYDSPRNGRYGRNSRGGGRNSRNNGRYGDSDGDDGWYSGPSSSGGALSQAQVEKQLKAMMAVDPEALKRRVNVLRVPPIDGVITKLQRLKFLPAIWFILSRKDCDLNAIKAGQARSLTSREEQEEIARAVDELAADQPEAVREKLVPALLHGMASHHAGHLPGWKCMIENLFQRGLIKIVFATGTLAAGLNMPARTTIISALGRKTDEGIKLLPHNELLQMAGRAGRRGFDTLGHCVVLQNRFEGAEEAFKIIKAGPEALSSQFKASYGLVLNLLSVYSLEEAKAFVQRSFGNFLQTEGQQQRMAEVLALESQARMLMQQFSETASADSKELNAAAKAARRELRQLKARALASHADGAVEALSSSGGLPRRVVLQVSTSGEPLGMSETKGAGAGTGSGAALGPGAGPGATAAGVGGGGAAPGVLLLPAVMVSELEAEDVAHLQTPGVRPAPFYVCLGADNRLMRVSAVHVVRVLQGQEGSLDAEDAQRVLDSYLSVRPNGWSNVAKSVTTCQVTPGNSSTAKIALKLLGKVSGQWQAVGTAPDVLEQVAAQRTRYKELLSRLEQQRRSVAGGQDSMARARRLLRRAEAIKEEMTDSVEGIWMTFKAVMEVLIAVNAMEADTLRLLPLGLLSRSLQAENELWLALALSHPAVADLNGPQLAAFLGALLSAEVVKRPMTMWDSYSSSEQVVRVVEALEPTREMLFELQSDAGLSRWNDSLLVDLRLAGLVEAWAAGAMWSEIMGDSTLDDGDIARLLMRTSDLLRQVVHTPQLLPHLKAAASEALRGMDRKPLVIY